MSRVFMISGLGADGRLFKNIKLPPAYEIVLTKVVDFNYTDTLSSYSQTIIKQYDIKPDDIVLGDSLGGMIAIEVAKIISPRLTILVSSIKTISEAPGYFRFFRAIPLYRIIPGKLLTSAGFLARYVFGDMNDEDARLFSSMLSSTSPRFMKWAMHAVLHWDNQVIPKGVYHIHGDADRVFPIKTVRPTEIIRGGSHIMVFDKAAEINSLLQELLD